MAYKADTQKPTLQKSLPCAYASGTTPNSSGHSRYYIGHTGDNLEERIRKHNYNHKGFTGRVGDWRVVFSEKLDSKEAAYLKEREVKKWKSRKLIEKLIGSGHPD